MEVTELRIGNVVFTESELVARVTGLHNKFVCFDGHTEDIRDCRGILLTEELMLKFGVEEGIGSTQYSNGKHVKTFHFECLSIQEEQNNGTFCVFITCGGYGDRKEICYLEYVHQLQNLYRALTGEELTVNA